MKLKKNSVEAEILKLNPDELIERIDFELSKKEFEESLFEFIKGAWHVIEPSVTMSSNWTMEAICEHLEATVNGSTRNLVVNIPPRFSKSLIVNVFFPAWVWAIASHEQFLFSSYAEALAIRDSIKCRTLIKSDWYQKRWPHVQIRHDQDTKKEFVLTDGGHRVVKSVSGSATGLGGQYLICFPYNTLISTDKGEIFIGDIVNNRLNVLIKSYNHSNNEIEYKTVLEYMDNGCTSEHLIEIDFGCGDVLTCTPNHPIWSITRNKYVRADELTNTDEVLYD